jgi:predicted ATPase
MNIKSIRLKNFKSIVDISIENIENFSVFTGPNGSGKSNIFEALEFLQDIILSGASDAIKKHNCSNNISHSKLKNSNKQIFHIQLSLEINNNSYDYELKINYFNLEKPIVYENIIKNEIVCKVKNYYEYFTNRTILEQLNYETNEIEDLLYFFKSIAYYKMNLLDLDIGWENNILNNSIYNIPSNLYNFAGKSIFNEIVSTMKKIFLDLGELGVQKIVNNISILFFRDKNSEITFYNKNIPYSIYQVFNILTIIYYSKKSLIMIEGIERGLSPEIIYKLVQFIRDNKKNLNIFISTYSESILKLTQLNELFFIDKKNGKTEIQKIDTLQNNFSTINDIYHCDICQKMIDLSYQTWNRVNFVRDNTFPLKIRETTITENILFELATFSKDCGFKKIEAFEAISEKRNGNDIEFFIQQPNGQYIFYPMQAKIIYKTNKYEQIPYTTNSGSSQNKLLLNYAKTRHGIPLYLLYNYYNKDASYKNYGCSIVDAHYINSTFSSSIHPSFVDLHISTKAASPWYVLVCKLLEDNSITMKKINEQKQTIQTYNYNEFFDMNKWEKIDFEEPDMEDKLDTKEKEFLNDNSDDFSPKYRVVLSSNPTSEK